MPSESLMDFILSCLEKTIFYSDSGFYTVGPVRLERSGKAFLPTEATGSPIPITGDELVTTK